MKIDATISANLSTVARAARHYETLGYDGLRVAELNHDPFLALTLAAEHTDRVELITSVAVAFARNPMSTAQLAHDLNASAMGVLSWGSAPRLKRTLPGALACPGIMGPRKCASLSRRCIISLITFTMGILSISMVSTISTA